MVIDKTSSTVSCCFLNYMQLFVMQKCVYLHIQIDKSHYMIEIYKTIDQVDPATFYGFNNSNVSTGQLTNQPQR